MKKIYVVLLLILMVTFTACLPIKDKEENINNEVNNEQNEVNENLKNNDDNSSEMKQSGSKRNEENNSNNDGTAETTDTDDVKIALEIVRKHAPEVKDSAFKFIPNSYNGNKDILVLAYDDSDTIIRYTDMFYVDLKNKEVKEEIQLSDYTIIEARMVEILGCDNPMLYLLVDNGINSQGLILYDLSDGRFNLKGSAIPSMPPAYTYLVDGNDDGIYEAIYEELMNLEVLYYSAFIEYQFEDNELFIENTVLDMGDYPETPLEVVKQYLNGLCLRNTYFEMIDEVVLLDERLDELVTEDALTPEMYLEYELLSNTSLEIEPKVVFEEIKNSEDSVTVVVSIKGEYYDSAGRKSDDINFSMTVIREDDKWKINGTTMNR